MTGMRSTLAVVAAVLAHGTLIGLLMGMSRSPIVGVILPLLLGLGGYRLIESLADTGPTPEPKINSIRLGPGLGWIVALWCAVVVTSVLAGIGLRNGTIRFGRPTATTFSLISLDQQPIHRIPELALVCAYYDRLDMNAEERRALASALSDTTVSTAFILTSLQDYFGKERGSSETTQSSVYDLYGLHRGGAR